MPRRFTFAVLQDSPGGNFDARQAFSGKLTQLGIWNRVLTDEEITDLASCKEYDARGNLVLNCSVSIKSMEVETTLLHSSPWM